MKLAVVFLLIGCVSFVLGACPECDGLSQYYNLVGATVLCKRGNCPTTYSIRKILKLHRAKQQCYFNGTYYNRTFVLPEQYPAVNGQGMCDYICVLTNGFYAFIPSNCQDNIPPTSAQCNDLFQISGGFILQFQNGIIFRPDSCTILVLPTSSLPPSNCAASKSKCCVYAGHFYKIGTVINVLEYRCICSCPPLMLCQLKEM